MITIQTVDSRIVTSNGAGANGCVIITPSEEFTYLELDDMQRKRVTLDPVQFNFKSGQFTDGTNPTTIKLAPTQNAKQDKSGLYYIAQFVTDTATWVEWWTLDDRGAHIIEFVDIIRVIVNPQASALAFVGAGDVSIFPTPNRIPRANDEGIIDFGWIGAIPVNMVINGYIGKISDFTIPAGTFAVLADTSDGQVKMWDGGEWDVIASGHTNTGLNSATPLTILAYMGGQLPTPPAGVLAFGLDTSQGQVFVWDGQEWNTISDGVKAPNYMVGTYIQVPFVGLIGAPLPNIPNLIMAIGKDTIDSQRKFWDGIGWHVIG